MSKTIRFLTPLVALAAAVAVVLPAASRKPKPPLCPGASYLLEPPLSGALGTALRADPTGVSIEGMCSPVEPKRFKAVRKGTKVKAKWLACDGLQGKVKLTGKLIDDCGTFKGKVKAKKFRRKLEVPRDTVLEATGTIGPAGGQVVSGDGALTLDVPAGALTEDTAITIRNLDPATLAADGADGGYVLTPDGLQFAVPATATFALDPASVTAGVLESDIVVIVTTGASGENPEMLPEQRIVLDTDGGTHAVSAPFTHFSRMYHFRPRDRAAARRARTRISINPDTRLQTGQAFTVDVRLFAGIAQREAKDIVHDNTVPPDDRVVYSGADMVTVGTIGVGASSGGGVVTGYACGSRAGFGTYSATVSAVVDPSISFGPLEVGGSVSLVTDVSVSINCNAPTTTTTSVTTTSSSSTTSISVTTTTVTTTSSSSSTSTTSTSSTSTSSSSSSSTSTTTVPSFGGCCECGPGMCASGPAIGPEDCPVACNPISGTFHPNSQCNLETGSCDVSVGRAVILDHQIGPHEVGTRLCLNFVRSDPDGCVATGPECLDPLNNPAPHLHRTIEVIGVGTGIADPNLGGCGHGRVVLDEPGCQAEDPIIPNCQ